MNKLGKPQVYDHLYAGESRRDPVRAAEKLVASELDEDHPMSKDMRKAIAFFDEIGWLTPVKLQEQASKE